MEGKLSQFLERYRKMRPPDETVRKEAAREIEKTTGTVLDIKDVSVKNGVVYVSAHPAVKNKILMKKAEILAKLRNSTGKNPPIDIK